MAHVINTPDGIAQFHRLQLMHALALEIKTGLKMSSRGSVMAQVNREYGTSFRTKKAALVFMEERVAEYAG